MILDFTIRLPSSFPSPSLTQIHNLVILYYNYHTQSTSDDVWNKPYTTYGVTVNSKENDKSIEIRLCNFERPHSRAFHYSWYAFFVAFFLWFSIVPLLPVIQEDLNLSDDDLFISSIASVGSTVVMRLLLGPLCDIYGARILFTIVLCVSAIPAACVGLIQTSQHLAIVRAFIGIAGGTFVMCEYWTTTMYTKDVVGTANAIVAGWGNLGAGVTQIVIGSLLFPFMKVIYTNTSSDDGVDIIGNNDDLESTVSDTTSGEKAWRTVMIIPAVIGFVTGIMVYFYTDDSPYGNYSTLKRYGIKKPMNATKSFLIGCYNRNTWLLSFQYACCFGVELTMNTATILYFKDEFGQSSSTAASIASIFGWMNLFARAIGGFYSDYANANFGMRGRLIVLSALLFGEAIFIFIFAETKTLAASIMVMVCFSLFVQAAEGAVYGIVPYVDEVNTGTIIGVVGAGGNVGATAFTMAFQRFDNYLTAFTIMGICIFVSSLLSVFIRIEGQNTLLSNHHVARTIRPIVGNGGGGGAGVTTDGDDTSSKKDGNNEEDDDYDEGIELP